MALYALGDLHLSLGTDKPMDVFGGAWTGYLDKLNRGLSILREEDTLVIVGDASWGLGLQDALADFRYISDLPGRKLLVKGNHDYWWSTAAKFRKFCDENELKGLDLLHNNCHLYGEVALCGTRGWFFEEDQQGTHNEKVFRRELCRLEASLQAAGEREKLCFLHYPPIYRGYRCQEILDLLHKYDVKQCYYGHLHSESHRLAIQGLVEGIEYRMVAADAVDFTPQLVLP
jgi:hypothetical protein